MPSKRNAAAVKPRKAAAKRAPAKKTKKLPPAAADGELVILTGMSGSGKLSALKAFEDLGYYSVDNLPLELIPRFADLVRQSSEIKRAALVVDVREGMRLDRFPSDPEEGASRFCRLCRVPGGERGRAGAPILRDAKTASDGPDETVVQGIRAERKRLDPIRNVADIVLDTTKFNVHELARAHQCPVRARSRPAKG